MKEFHTSAYHTVFFLKLSEMSTCDREIALGVMDKTNMYWFYDHLTLGFQNFTSKDLVEHIQFFV